MLENQGHGIRALMPAHKALDRHVLVGAQVEFVHRPHVACRAVEGGAAVRERHALRTLKRVAVAAGIRKGVSVVELPVGPHVNGPSRPGLQELVGRKNRSRDAYVVNLAVERKFLAAARADVQDFRLESHSRPGSNRV